MSLIGDPRTRLTWEARAYWADNRVMAKCSVNTTSIGDAIARTLEHFEQQLGFRPKFIVWSRVR